MVKEQLNKIFAFLEDKEEQNPPFMWKYMNNIPLTEDDLNIKGDLILTYSDIESLPKGLKVDDYLNIRETTLLEYTDDELREMIQPGFIKGQIIR